MTISLTPKPSDVLGSDPVPLDTLTFYRGELRHIIHAALLRALIRQEQQTGYTRTELAERIHKDKGQITRWLAVPSNFTLDTLSDLLIGLRVKLRAFDLDPFDAATPMISQSSATDVSGAVIIDQAA